MNKAEVHSLAARHGVRVVSIRPHNGLGVDNDIWFLDEELVLRTPKGDDTAVFMEGEIANWEIAQRGGVKVPDIVAHGRRDDGVPFMIVRRVRGSLLGELSAGADLSGFREDMAEQIALLHSLSGRPWEEARSFDDYDPWSYFQQVRDSSLLPSDDLAEIEMFVGRLEGHAGNYCGSGRGERQPPDGWVLTHNDLHAWNLMVDGDPPRLVSILDWGDSCVSDRRNDLSTLPLDLQIEIAEAYRSAVSVGPSFEARVLWAWLDIALWEIVNMEKLGFHRPWWRWPVGDWPQVKEILRSAGSGWMV